MHKHIPIYVLFGMTRTNTCSPFERRPVSPNLSTIALSYHSMEIPEDAGLEDAPVRRKHTTLCTLLQDFSDP